MKRVTHACLVSALIGAAVILFVPLFAQESYKTISVPKTPPARYDLLILDADPPVKTLESLEAADIDGDGNVELATGGEGGLLWYRPATLESGVIARGDFHVGVAVCDIDGDGIQEVAAGHRIEPGTTKEDWMISWFKPQRDLSQPWIRHTLDPATTGGPHDMLFVDLNSDGNTELVAIAVYTPTPGIFAYMPQSDPTKPWKKHEVETGFTAEGTVAADLDGDGRTEIVSGPYWYTAPAGGAFAGPWKKNDLAVGFRDMCRDVLIDLNGDGLLDAVVVESEYPDGRMSWFENHIKENPARPWIEHPMEKPFNFAHSLSAWRDRSTGQPHVMVAEMAKGGWDAPYNWDARMVDFAFSNGGRTWQREMVYQGAGTHNAIAYDIDGDGETEFIGKGATNAWVQIWKRRKTPSPLARYRHHFLDRDKPETCTDILAADVDSDGHPDVVCGSWWYKNPTWERRSISGINQAITAYDIDGDGRIELIGTKRKGNQYGYNGLGSELVWLKPVDAPHGKWQEHPIGTGKGDWPHGNVVAALLPSSRPALVTGYHSAGEPGDVPEIFEVPSNPKHHPWPKRILAEIKYGEEFVASDLNGDGKLDLVAGPWWVENLGDGNFRSHRFAPEDFVAARVAVADINKDGRPDVVLGEEVLDFQKRVSPFSRVAWFENPSDPTQAWKMHVIDKIRCPHSIAVADLDGDGQVEVIAGEHDPFKEYRSRCRLMVYNQTDARGQAWYRAVLDDRFEHHDGTKVFELSPGRLGILSHGWKDSAYVHLWEVE